MSQTAKVQGSSHENLAKTQHVLQYQSQEYKHGSEALKAKEEVNQAMFMTQGPKHYNKGHQ